MNDYGPKPIRVVFFGTADFAVPSLLRLSLHPRFAVVAVVTQPDRPRGRGRSETPPPIKVAAEQLGVPVLQPTRLRSARLVSTIRDMEPDFLVVAAYGRILPADMLAVPRIAPVNVHGSLLPRYRGAAPIQRALMDGCAVTGVTTMLMVEELDAGDILLTAAYAIRDDDDAGTVTQSLAELGAALIVDTLLRLHEGELSAVPQDQAEASYAPPITPDDAVIRWSDTAAQVCNRVRAMAPRPGAVTTYEGRKLKVLRARPGGPGDAAEPGEVIVVGRDGVIVQACDAPVVIETVHPEGRRPMPAADWARGARVTAGGRFL